MSWEKVLIDEISTLVTKGTTPTTIGKGFTDNGITFIKAEALNGDSNLAPKGFSFIDEETHEQLRRSRLAEADVLITIAGAQIGKCGYVRAEHLPANTNQAVGIIRINPEKAIPRFVYYYFKQATTFAFIQSLSGQAAQPNINLSMLKRIEILLPSYAEQKHVAEILSAYDDLIENNLKRIALLEDAARQLYKEWFVRLRFLGHEHTRIVDGVPERWERVTAFDVLDVLSGGTPKTTTPDFWDGEIPFFTPKDAEKPCYVLTTEKYLTEQGLSKCNSKLYPKNTIFITARGTVGNLNLAQRPMAMNQSCYALRGKDAISQLFLFCALRDAIDHFKQHASGAVFDAIIVDTFKLIPFVRPEAKIIEFFDTLIEPTFRQVENLLLQNQKLKQARDLLLPRLMTGDIPV